MADDHDRFTDQQTTEAPETAASGAATAVPQAPRHAPGVASHMPPPAGDAGSAAKAEPGASRFGAVRKRAVRVLTTAVSAVTTVVVATLAVHIVFVAFEANPANEIVNTVAEWAEGMAWEFKDVFQPSDPKAGIAVNYGLAAVVYLVIGRLLAGLIRHLD
ncbi:hypothetical protein [Actinomadura sp. SCN-SB]|uniref:hypothetical protein n=1 Tax=Actinomadura sp. SCN-SB TaxID=3373092 RepID=UPI003751C373